jgi:hypothetical protein
MHLGDTKQALCKTFATNTVAASFELEAAKCTDLVVR